MWIMLPEIGFLSVVADKNDGARVMVRARRRADLVKLLAKHVEIQHPSRMTSEIVATPHADYPFRVFMMRADFAEVLSMTVDDLSYTNFKSEVGRLGNLAHEHVYHAVWSVLRGLEQKGARKS